MLIKLHNLRSTNIVKGKSIYCGRGSSWGNPYVIMNGSTRDNVCDWFKEYFLEKLKEDKEFNNEFNELIDSIKHLEEVTLLCFCYPKRCHTETIRDEILKRLKEINNDNNAESITNSERGE